MAPQSRFKDLVLSCAVVGLFFICVEIGARVYHSIKYRDASVFLYGRNFLKNFIQEKEVSPDKSYDPYMDKAMLNDAAERAFKNRYDNDTPLPYRKPSKEIIAGHYSYINSLNMRNSEIALPKSIMMQRIVTTGGSFVAGVGVADDETWPFLLNHDLNRRGYRCEIINAGQAGNTITHVLLNLFQTYIKIDADCIILITAYNNKTFLRNTKDLPFTWHLSNLLYNTSQFYAMVREKLARVVYKDNNYFLYNYNIKLSQKDADDVFVLYIKRLNQFYHVCKERDITLILGLEPLSLPYRLKNLQDLSDLAAILSIEDKLGREGSLSYYELSYYMQAKFNSLMAQFGRQNNIPVFDGNNIFHTDKYEYFIDEIHLNKKGTQVFADALADFLIKNNLVRNAAYK